MEPTSPWDFATLEACGALRSSADDLLRFAAANMGEVKTPLFEVMKVSHEKRNVAASETVEVGLCWHRLKLADGRVAVWHNGGTGGFRSMVAFTPDTRRAVVALCSADVGAAVDKMAFKVLTAIQPK
jgi:CubicO group peptidase (beta-lactamase class C family)